MKKKEITTNDAGVKAISLVFDGIMKPLEKNLDSQREIIKNSKEMSEKEQIAAIDEVGNKWMMKGLFVFGALLTIYYQVNANGMPDMKIVQKANSFARRESLH